MNFNQGIIDAYEHIGMPRIRKESFKAENGAFEMKPVAKQIIDVAASDIPKLKEFFSDFNKLTYDACKPEDGKDITFDHVYNNAECNLVAGKFFFSKQQVVRMKYCEESGEPMKLAVYGCKKAGKGVPSFISKAFCPDLRGSRKAVIPDAEEVVVPMFAEDAQPVENGPYTFYPVNLPYSFYKDIYVPEKLYEYDMGAKKTTLCYLDTKRDTAEINSIVKSFVDSKIPPVAMALRDNCIVGVEYDWPLILSKHYKLPYLPALVTIPLVHMDYECMYEKKADRDAFNEAFAPYCVMP